MAWDSCFSSGSQTECDKMVEEENRSEESQFPNE